MATSSNVKQLQEADALLPSSDLTKEQIAAIEILSEDEVRQLIAIRQKLGPSVITVERRRFGIFLL